MTRRSILAGAAGLSLTEGADPGALGRGQVEAQAQPPPEPEPETVVVGFPLYDGATLLDFAGATQVFAFAGSPKIRFQPTWLAARMAPVITTEGVSVMPNRTFAPAPTLDVLFVPGGGANGVIAAMFDPVFQRFLTDQAPKTRWVGSVCTGAFLLAAAGLIDGCEVTTYWSQLENLALLSNKLKLRIAKACPRSVFDPRRPRFTGGGVSSSLDLALELVQRIAAEKGLDGEALAQQAQLSIQYAPRPHVHAGDPCEAPPALVATTRDRQEKTFVAPVRQAVRRLLVD
jgi:cyclohexyl-isocyanide hydratase